MFITDNYGAYQCPQIEEFKERIREVFGRPDNEIWISENDDPDDMPCMGILVKGDQAVINYFNTDVNYVSASKDKRDGTLEFCNGMYEILKEQILPKEDVIRCALEFFSDKACPKCIEWEEL